MFLIHFQKLNGFTRNTFPHTEALFLTRYIEKFGTGILMMIRESLATGLPEPQFEQRAGEFVTTIGRDWLTAKILSELQLNDRQRQAITLLKTAGRLSNADYQKLTNAIKKTASRDLEDLRRKGVVLKIGKTGRGTYYVLSSHGDIKGTKETSKTQKRKGT
jgi:ATP-dependent DNA helicase RecG